jgi:Ca2+-binding RTX toxin-like protein
MLARSGYSGSNPIADGHLKLTSDGHGGTQVWFDMDGLAGGSGTWLVTTLDGIGADSLSYANGRIIDSPPAAPPDNGGSAAAVTVYASDSVYAAPDSARSIVLTGWQQTTYANNHGDTIISNNSGNHIIGGTGADTIVLGRAGDIVSGGGGADTFAFSEVPWAGGRITDFLADDTLDLSAMLSRYGYSGSNPLADGHVKLAADGAGGTQVWFDMNGLAGGSGSWLVTTLDGVSASSLQMSNGRITESGAAPSASGGGQTFVLDNSGSSLSGTSGRDTIILGRGGNVVTGGGGNDVFAFNEVPWAGGHITDFASGDGLNLSGMFSRYGYTGTDPIADGRVKLVADGAGGSQVLFNLDGLSAGSGTWVVTTLDHVNPASVHLSSGWITI